MGYLEIPYAVPKDDFQSLQLASLSPKYRRCYLLPLPLLPAPIPKENKVRTHEITIKFYSIGFSYVLTFNMLASSRHVHFFFLTDQQPPTITCPPDSSNGTDPERPTRTVAWNDPVVSDNSMLHDPNAAPTVVRSPSHITSPYDFPVGVTRITYTATDRSNHSSSCVFTVTVIGESICF